jgi:RNA polymerase sigma factor (TIGR02999 family)
LFNVLYQDLHRIARARLSHGGRNTLLDTTALINETYLRLSVLNDLRIEDRNGFLAYASRAMRSVVVDLARSRAAVRHGGDFRQVTLNTHIADLVGDGEDEIIRVHEALEELAAVDPRIVEVVEMRYFAGLTQKEVADALGISERTVYRTWEKARMLLAAALQRPNSP